MVRRKDIEDAQGRKEVLLVRKHPVGRKHIVKRRVE
jgi:hypothetical protein